MKRGEEARPPAGSGLRSPRPALAIAVLFFCSGAAALMVETTWQRWFRLLLGATAPATAATLVAFFTGHALGALLGTRLAERTRRALGLYGRLELAAAATALLVPWLLTSGEALLSLVYDPLVTTPSALVALRFAVALAVSLPAAICFGATLPVIAAAAMPDARELGSKGAGLYGVNLLGAVFGTLLSAFVLPEQIGISGSYGVALALSVAAGCSALLLERRHPPAAPPRSGPPRRPGQRAPLRRKLVGLALFSGLGSFALQVLLVHSFGLVLNQSLYAFGLVLATVLATLALGALLGAAWERRLGGDPRTLLALVLGLAALALAAFPALLVDATTGLQYVGSDDPWPGYLLEALGLVARTAGPALLAVGLVFPLTLALASRDGADRQSASGALGPLVAANTVGAIGGALAAPFLLLPLLGPWLPFTLLAAAYALASLAMPLQPRWRLRRDLLLALGWIAILTRASPLSLPVVNLPQESLLHLEHSGAGTVAVALRDGERLIQIDNHYSLGGTAERVHAERQGHLPLLLAPGARRVAFLGSATAISAGAATAHPIDRLVMVELVPGVSRSAQRFFRDANRAVHEDPRSAVVLDDARNFLRQTREVFDVIVADLFVPWRAGTASLYSREHFQAARARLSADGLFCQWLPLYQLSQREFEIVAATFLDVFPRAALFRGDFFGSFPIVALVGWKGQRAGAAAVAEATQRLAAAGETDRWIASAAGPWALFVGSLSPSAPSLAGVPRQRDARPILDFLAARGHAGGGAGKRDPLTGLAWIRTATRLRDEGRRAGDPLLEGLPPEWRLAVEGGAALQAAGAFYAVGREREAERALALASQRLPPTLLADAPPDPTAAEVWHTGP